MTQESGFLLRIKRNYSNYSANSTPQLVLILVVLVLGSTYVKEYVKLLRERLMFLLSKELEVHFLSILKHQIKSYKKIYLNN